MPIYHYKCLNDKCLKEFESIEKMRCEFTYCLRCKKLSKRIHGQDLPNPAQIEIGVGGVYRGKFPERKYS